MGQTSDLRRLIDTLNSMPTGPIGREAASHIIELLSSAWRYLDGGAKTKMEDWKLDRGEKFSWDKEAQILGFQVERHGAIVGGNSSRAELQGWQVDLKDLSATHSVAGYRQRPDYQRPRSIPIDAIAHDIAQAVRTGASLEGIIRKDANTLEILPGHFIPDAGLAKQTLQSRRKRFRTALELALNELGWERDPRSKPHTFRRRAE